MILQDPTPVPYLATDPRCVLYLRQTGTANGGTVFRDWSRSHKILTAPGTVVNSTTGKFSPGSIYFNGTWTSYLSTPHVSDFDFGTGDFSQSAWVKDTYGSWQEFTIIGQSTGTGNGNPRNVFCITDSGGIFFYDYTQGNDLVTTNTPTYDLNWHHWAVRRVKGIVYGYMDGVLLNPTVGVSITPSSVNTNEVHIGRGQNSSGVNEDLTGILMNLSS